MTKRGFNASKSAEADRINDNADSSMTNGAVATLSPPQVYGQRKKLTDLKIDFNFVPKKNKTKNGVGGNPSGPEAKSSQQPKIRVSNAAFSAPFAK